MATHFIESPMILQKKGGIKTLTGNTKNFLGNEIPSSNI